MGTIEKNMNFILQSEKLCLSLSLPNRRKNHDENITSAHIGRTFVRISSVLLRRFGDCKRYALFFVPISAQIFDDKCQTVSRICDRRMIRFPHTYSLRNRHLNTSSLNFHEVAILPYAATGSRSVPPRGANPTSRESVTDPCK